MSATKYRADIDGLRSLAILPVLFYHAGIPGFSGGYVGVDVFFVISGFLITTILLKQFSENSYCVFDFYERRLRRIFPALLLVVASVLLVAPFTLLPSEFATLGRDATASLLFVANINFWLQTGYFTTGSEAKPLLHMWSLGVEEQFYLFAPIGLYLILRFAPKLKLSVLMLGLTASFVASVYLTPRAPTAAFYLLPTRAWELLAGAALAAFASEGRTLLGNFSRLRSALGIVGAALILVPVFSYSKSTQFPGYAAILPVLGATLLIATGPGSLSGRLLAHPLLVRIGLISYSLYLWHWPLVVFFRNEGWLDSLLGSTVVIFMSFVLAWFTWRFVESPTRDRSRFPKKWLSAASLFGVAALIACSTVYSTLDGWPSRVPTEVATFDRARLDVSPDRERCHVDEGLPPIKDACSLGPNGPSRVVVWGDSHGVELAKALSDEGVPVLQLTYSSCPPSLRNDVKAARPRCAAWNRQVLDYLVADVPSPTVVLSAYYGLAQLESETRRDDILATARHLAAAGINVVIVGPYPIIDGITDLPTYLARGGAAKRPVSALGPRELDKAEGPLIHTVFPERIFCQEGICDFAPGGNSLLFDAHHPSMHAARAVAKLIVPLIQNQASRPDETEALK